MIMDRSGTRQAEHPCCHWGLPGLRGGTLAVFALFLSAVPAMAFTVTDFSVDAAHATLGDPHQVASPPFNNFQLTIYGTFSTNKCYQVKIKREGSGQCGSANSSGSDDAVVFGNHLVVDVSANQQNADFKSGDDWRIEIKERNSGCTGGSTTLTFPTSAGQPYLKISGCNGSCLMSGLTMTTEPNPVGCGGAVQVCAKKSGGGTLGSGNLEYDWDLNGNGTCGTCSGGSNSGKKCGEPTDCPGGSCVGGGGFTELTTHTGDAGCPFGQPCCITVNINSMQTVGVKVRDLGTQVACTDCKTKAITVNNTCGDGLFCNGAETCSPTQGCVPGTPPNCADNVACTIDGCVDDPGTCGNRLASDDGGVAKNGDSCEPPSHTCTHTPSNSLCNDGLYCNGTETCNATTGCQPGSPVNCADGVSCTIDACNESTDSCTHTPNNSACNDGLWCNGTEICDPVQGCKPGTPPNCNDNIACTIDSCNENNDSCSHKPNNSVCNDGLWCNGVETCDPVLGCKPGTPPNCDDGIPCTVDSCNEANDTCVHTPSNSVCNDGLWCNGTETCSATQGCQAGTPPNCNDNISCTTDSCNEANDTCVHAPNNSSCNDGLYCNGTEVCNPTLGCQAGTPINCSDGISCTTDSCNEANDTCVHTPNNSSCSDGLWCNGTETCSATLGCQAGTPPNCNDNIACTIDSCNESNDTCSHKPSNSLCNDGLWCNGTETCSATQGCLAGTPPNCADNVACTIDSCNEATDSCNHVANDSACSDGLFCNGVEYCHLTKGCKTGTAPNCNDNIPCTTDTCNETADRCDHTPNNATCSNGLFCDGQEICDPVLGCRDNTDPCASPLICIESTDKCVQCTTNSQCNDGAFCNGEETCNTSTGTCVAGTPPTCNDNIACTVDTCNPATNSCVHTPNHSACSNNLYCDGAEICSPTLGCQAGTPINCGDSVGCTVDTCDEVNDTCVHTPNNATCSDGLFCNGTETCHPTLGCQAGTAPNCNDGVSCTVDACDEAHDTCTHSPSNSLCSDGQFCNGAETCDPVNGCQAGVAPDCNDGIGCTVDACDEAHDTCTHSPSNSLCSDGQYCNGTETCSATLGCQSGTPVNCNDGIACTADSCNEATDSCDHTPNNGACSDGLYCNGSETCDPLHGCIGGAAPNCNDNVACTIDSCDEEHDTCKHVASNSACDDGAYCNGAEVCDPVNGCHAGTAPNCDDGVSCTVDACDEAHDSCTHTANNSQCNDGLYCNGTETCHPTLGCQAGTPVNCNDGIACTSDGCDEATDSCFHTPNNGSCNDNLYCNGTEFCSPTLGCQSGTPVNCDDNIACTADTCNEATDSCDHTPNSGLCGDGLYCNGVEVCNAIHGCLPGSPVNCDDGVTCTVDACNESTDSCTHSPSNSLCDDGLYCNGSETCHPTQGCLPGTGPNCDDHVACTVDSCDEASDSCRHLPDHEACNNDVFCDGTESCDPVLGCVDNSDPCAPPTICDEPNSRCVSCLTNAQCNDGLYCNGTETCNTATGTCVPGTPPACDDGLACTMDSCSPASDSCVHVPDHGACDDGQYCNGLEFCSPTLGCQPGTTVNCDDGVACTTDACNEIDNVCTHTPNPQFCDNGLFCDGVEVCDPVIGCHDGADPCAASYCNENTDLCVECLSNAHCDDGVFCNGTETCNAAGSCVPGTPPTCSDGVACTIDVCNLGTDACEHTVSDAACSDGQYCNGVEVCNATLGCQAGTPPDCNDHVGCTVDSCNEATDSCRHNPSDSLCSDSSYCNGAEVCDPVNGCMAGAPPVCNDGVACTVDSCDESIDSCVYVPNNGACNDGLYCNGLETCDAVLGCLAGTAPNCDDAVACTADSCNEATDSCDHSPVNAACDDGLFCNGVEACDTLHGCVAGTAPNCNDGVACTIDVCDEAHDTCVHSPNHAACNDQQFCNGVEVCDAVDGCLPGTAPDCNDNVGCTVDSCDEFADVCVHSPNDGLCNDGQYCNGLEICNPLNGCESGTPPNCDDGVTCTLDSCDETNDVCVHSPDHHSCDDGLFCDGQEVCDSQLGCQDALVGPCEGNLYCDETIDTCVECLSDENCNDGVFCNGTATCESGICMPGTPPNCDDGIPCTVDSCDPLADACVHTPNDFTCNDGVFCNGVEICSMTQGCQPGTPPVCDDGVACTVDVCSPASDSCVSTPNNASCSDGLYCDGEEVCNPMTGCGPGTAPNCNDGVGCTVDSCDESTDSCVHAPSNSLCSDSQYCNGVEVCDPVNGCQSGPPVSCDDAVSCTVDACDEATDSCTHTPSDSVCSDGQFCNGSEVCSPTQGCQPGTPPNCNDSIACTTDSCNEAKDLCVHTPVNSTCSDGLYCNGQEVCVVGVGCQAGAPPNCNDGIACTADSCNEATDSCVNTPQNSLCDDGLFCNGAEVCDSIDGCEAGTPPNCNDSIGCTVDSCNESTRSCINLPQNSLCDDGAFCNGVETCKPGIGCTPGTAPSCNDGSVCTVDICDEAQDKCVHALAMSSCDDGDPCTEDACSPSSGCTHNNICGACCLITGNCINNVSFSECMSLPGDSVFHGFGSVCLGDADGNGADDACGVGLNQDIPTVSEWGIVILALMLLIGAKIHFAVRRQAA